MTFFTRYQSSQEQFTDSFCPTNDPCGSTRCVQIYKDGLGAWGGNNDDDHDLVSNQTHMHSGDLTKMTMWTRAYFEVGFQKHPKSLTIYMIFQRPADVH